MTGRHARRPEGPVFVDPTGRRSRAVRRAGLVLTALMAGYLVLALVALAGPPRLARIAVPGLGPVLPGAPALRTDGGARVPAGDALEPSRSPAATGTPAAAPTGSPAASPSPAPAAASPSPAPLRTTGPATASRGGGRATDKPAPPGAAVRPSRPAR